MAKPAVILTGDKQLDRRLKNLDAKLGKKVVRQATRKALRPVMLTTKRNAPKDSGVLRKSVKIRALKRSRSRFGSRVSGIGGNNFAGTAYYGGFQEWGWKTKSGRKIPGKRFMKQAAESKRRSAIVIFKAEVKKGIEREATI